MDVLERALGRLEQLAGERDRTWLRIKSEWMAARAFMKAIATDAAVRDGLLMESTEAFERRFMEHGDPAAAAQAAEEVLAGIARGMKEYTVHYVGHAHIDMNWMWPWQETVGITYNTFRTAQALMAEEPELVMAQSQASTYEAMKSYAPEIYAEIKRLACRGQWEIAASTWVEGDKNMAYGESQVRQLALTRKFFAEEFGLAPEDVRVDWEPDLFGHPLMTPQILAKSGVKYYYFCRGGKGPRLFWWESPDGSRVLAFDDGKLWYLGPVVPEQVVEAFSFARETGLKDYLIVFGIGDHGGGPTREDLALISAMRAWPIFPTVRFGRLHDYFAKAAGRPGLPVVREELNCVFRGCYTSHADLKQANRTAENLLLTAEALAVLADRVADFPYPAEILDAAWRRTCFNQFHDILPGSGKRCTSDYAQGQFQETCAAANVICERAMHAVEAKIDTTGQGIPLVVFNQLAWARTEPVVAMLYGVAKEAKNLTLRDETGTDVPVQIVESGWVWGPVPPSAPGHDYFKLVFVAEKVPGLGYRTYRVFPGEQGALAEARLTATEDGQIETPFYRARLDTATGAFSRLQRKVDGWEIVRPGELLGRMQVLHEAPHAASAWEIGQITGVEEVRGARVKLLEQGPVRLRYQVQHQWHRSKLETDVVFYAGSDRLDFHLCADWLEYGDALNGAPMLRVFFPAAIGEASPVYEIPFGHIRRAADGLDVPALRWGALADAGDRAHGITVLNDCKYGYGAMAHELHLTLLRSSYEPDPWADLGRHTLGYAVLPNPAGWTPAWASRRGSEYNQPMLAVVPAEHEGPLPKTHGCLEVTGAGVVSCVKKGADGRGLILRLFEADGAGGRAEVQTTFGYDTWEEVDLLERPTGGRGRCDGALVIELGPYEIKSLRLS